jgi:hypothetical protein
MSQTQNAEQDDVTICYSCKTEHACAVNIFEISQWSINCAGSMMAILLYIQDFS